MSTELNHTDLKGYQEDFIRADLRAAEEQMSLPVLVLAAGVALVFGGVTKAIKMAQDRISSVIEER